MWEGGPIDGVPCRGLGVCETPLTACVFVDQGRSGDGLCLWPFCAESCTPVWLSVEASVNRGRSRLRGRSMTCVRVQYTCLAACW